MTMILNRTIKMSEIDMLRGCTPVSRMLEGSEAAIITAEHKALEVEAIGAAEKAIPDLIALSDQLKTRILGIGCYDDKLHVVDWHLVPANHEPMKDDEFRSILRGDAPYRAHGRCDSDLWVEEDGTHMVHLRDEALDKELVVAIDTGLKFPGWQHRAKPEYAARLAEVIPRSHRALHLHTLVPWNLSPTPYEVQARQIESLKRLPADLRGLVMLGPPGTSKTAFASAWLADEITDRVYEALCENSADSPICVWRIKANRWIADNRRWITRDFDDPYVQPPELCVEAIEKACNESGYRPILWIEELDKIRPNKHSDDLIDSLIDTIYELNGLVLLTSNYTFADFSKAVSPATLRRILGTTDDPTKFKL